MTVIQWIQLTITVLILIGVVFIGGGVLVCLTSVRALESKLSELNKDLDEEIKELWDFLEEEYYFEDSDEGDLRVIVDEFTFWGNAQGGEVEEKR